ncbi:MAG TPA: circularly permuted type 2 ATP-grasp protein [Opitutaceae bacterium]|nr:circularly permuted type 2 ATP-grasp protein [Opitutaceae bacterium]
MPVFASPPLGADPLPGYTGRSGRYDECRAPDGTLRPHWAQFLRLLGPNPSETLRAANDACGRAVLEQDVSMNVYAGARSESHPWPLDVVPHLVSAEDWAVLSDGLRQRARLYDTLLADLYGPQKYLRSGALPAELAMANPHFLRPCAGLGKRSAGGLHTYAVDIARSPDGQWWVLQDRLDAPSGLGYSLQNRRIVRTALAPAFHGTPVRRLYSFFRGFRSSLADLGRSSARSEEPRVVFLTPGPANETYFEHAYLARYLGYPLVEGADLTTRDRQVFIRTVGGLKRVDAIVRRVDSGFCDPLELNPHSVLGVPGLVHAVHGGRVALANQLGGAALESSALLAFLKPLCREVLGEDLRLPSVATWWCGHAAAREYVLGNLRDLVVKPAFRERGAFATRYGALLGDEERADLAREIAARPGAFCGQERVLLGTTPAWSDGALRPVPFVMRLFVAWQDGDYRVMSGGLTRFSPSGADAIVSLQKGAATKDTWVLGPGREEAPPPINLHFADLDRRPAATPSRMADNLFWLGRYLERTSQLARLLDRHDPLLRDEIAALDPSVATDALRLLIAAQQSVAPADATADEIAAQIRVDADDTRHPGSLAANLGHLIRILDQVKVNLPPEFWRILRRLRGIAAHGHPQLASDLVEQLSSLEALGNETVAHDTGWRFLELGRRIERARQIVFLARALLLPKRAAGEAPATLTEFRLQTLLHFTDSLFTYRSVYHGIFDPASIFAWLLGAQENPRGLLFQTERIAEHLAALPEELAPRAASALRATAHRLVSTVKLFEVPNAGGNLQRVAEFFDETSGTLTELNDRLTQIYFSHSELPAASS